MAQVKIGIIGGSGMDDPQLLQDRQEKFVETPFGKPSDALITGKIGDVQCVLLARHGRKHQFSPTNVNYRANIWALKEEGCTHVLVTTACGSLQEEYQPGDIVILDQFIDRTQKRQLTFYDGAPGSPQGVLHFPAGEPFCGHTRKVLVEVAVELGIKHHTTGTGVTIEGPRFSTKAESNVFRSWGAHIINMTTVPEAGLALEAGLSYAAIALVTDYDCWRENTEHVNIEIALRTFRENATKATNMLLAAIPKIAAKDWTDIIKANQDLVQQNIMGLGH